MLVLLILSLSAYLASKVIPAEKYVPFSTQMSLIVGQEQDDFGGGFSLDQSMHMEVTQINVWSRILDKTEIQDMADCQTDPTGDLVQWNLRKWDKNEDALKFKERELESLCQTPYKADKVIITYGVSPDNQESICTAMGGKQLSPDLGAKDFVKDLDAKAKELMAYIVENGHHCW